MKVILTTLNAKFIHSSLALRYLKAYCEKDFPKSIELYEYTINHHLEQVVADLYQKQGDIYCFSCYIFNIEETLRVIKDLRKVLPSVKIIVGGPEVSFDSQAFLREQSEIDIVIKGEGEVTFYELMRSFHNQEQSLENLLGITYRQESDILENEDRPLIHNLDQIPFPYMDGLEELNNRIIYYEAARGCPYRCQYCLSSTIKGVRYFSLERVKEDLKVFMNAKVPQVKFVDRTFNCDKKRTLEIWNYIKEQDLGITNFHFEMAADLIDDEMIAFLGTIRAGLIQFEIGVQSTNKDTLKEIQRTIRFEKLKTAVMKIGVNRNIHQHLDLIAGLPKEDYTSFGHSFDDVYNLRPDKIQMGFLKLLKGSGIRERAKEHGYVYREHPPYEVLYNKYISFSEMLRLKSIEEMVESYYNSHRFEYAVQYIINTYFNSPFRFFESMSIWWEENHLQEVSHKDKLLYDYLYAFYEQKIGEKIDIFAELLKFDLLRYEKIVQLPKWAPVVENFELQKRIFDFYWQEEQVAHYLPELLSYSPKQRARIAHIEVFNFNILDENHPKETTTILFHYKHNDSNLKQAKHFKIKLDI